ncbi:uncharacterized protein LOC119370166 [Jatropha curcas]|uniref:uncharacterized protein LOC119370166 n=1 Tax=Jatropha curcas TaxID=180498 RepID=UPI001895CA3B|nr:uncharacterized protein LOC119370166 [Jatropha curcas]
MQAGHLLLGRPWQYDRRALHDGFHNRYSLIHKGKKVVLVPLSPQEVYEDQRKIVEREREVSALRKHESENLRMREQKREKSKDEGKEATKITKQINGPIVSEKQKREEKKKQTFYARTREVKCAIALEKPAHIASLGNFDEMFFPSELPSGVTTLRGIDNIKLTSFLDPPFK